MKLSTFCSCETTLETALKGRADHLILEDPKLSLRSYNPHYQPGFTHINKLAQKAHCENPTLELSFNLDIMVHHSDFPLIQTLLDTLKNGPISMIRVQDPGLATWIKKEYPHFKIHLNLETGNHSALGMKTYSQFFDSQTLTNELPIFEIKRIKTETKTPLEIQVFGPILIQYSKRRYLSEVEKTSQEDYVRLAHDEDYPGRIYRFYDNQHGHLMYLYFDRCLIQDLPALINLDLDYWLVDGRGESPDYLSAALEIFKAEYTAYQKNPETWTLSRSNWEKLTQNAPRPLKPGFFRANLTDQDRGNAWETVRSANHLATVLDFEKGHFIAIEIHRPFEKNSQATLITPKGKRIALILDRFFDLKGHELDGPPNQGLALIPWQKNISAQSRIYNLQPKC